MILKHTFDQASHVYSVPGRFVLATGDIIDLTGLSDLSQVPTWRLEEARQRGEHLHKAIEAYEMGQDWQKSFPSQYQPYLDGYFAFRDEHEIQVLPPMEKQYVYLHESSDQAIGGTIDMRFLYQGDLWIADIKSVHPASGKALKQKKLAWRLQTESYSEATQMDEQFLASLDFKKIRRCVLHIHPKLTAYGKRGYEFHDFPQDDALLWDGAVRMAFEKLAAGLVPKKREVLEEPDTRQQLEDSLAITDDDVDWWYTQHGGRSQDNE